MFQIYYYLSNIEVSIYNFALNCYTSETPAYNIITNHFH